MKMSLEYMRETATIFAQHGFALSETTRVLQVGETSAKAISFALERETSLFTLETVCASNGDESYYLEIRDHHGLVAPSYRLDSWKHRATFAEFRYYADLQTGCGLSFKIYWDPTTNLRQTT